MKYSETVDKGKHKEKEKLEVSKNKNILEKGWVKGGKWKGEV